VRTFVQISAFEIPAVRRPAATSAHRVLVVDDDDDVRDVVRHLLEVRGIEVWTAANGYSALRLLERAETLPCLLLLDLWMPVMDGFTTCEALRARPQLRDLPVVLMTACDLTRSLISAPTLKKPFALDQLTALVAQLDRRCEVCAARKSFATER
jgi:CheY-like chemotaxis protein